MLRRILIVLGILAVLAVAGVTAMVGGPRNLIGMLRYDQRREGDLKLGDRAPDVELLARDGSTSSTSEARSSTRQRRDRSVTTLRRSRPGWRSGSAEWSGSEARKPPAR